MYEAELEVPEECRGLRKIPSVGEVWIYFDTTHYLHMGKIHNFVIQWKKGNSIGEVLYM